MIERSEKKATNEKYTIEGRSKIHTRDERQNNKQINKEINK